MTPIFKLVCGDETLNLDDDTQYSLHMEGLTFPAGATAIELKVEVIANPAEVGTLQRLKRNIDRMLEKARRYDLYREGQPVDLVVKLDDGLPDYEPVYGRGHSRRRVQDGVVELPSPFKGYYTTRGKIPFTTIKLLVRDYWHGEVRDVANCTGAVREELDKGLSVWEATTNLIQNPAFAYPLDWDNRWYVGPPLLVEDFGASPVSTGLTLSSSNTGAVSVSGGAVTLNSYSASGDAALCVYNTQLPTSLDWQIETRWTAASIRSGVRWDATMVVNHTGAPAIQAWVDPILEMSQNSDGTIQMRYYQAATSGSPMYYNGTAWSSTAACAYSDGVLGSTYQSQIRSNGTSWTMLLSDSNAASLVAAGSVAWASVYASASLWALWGDPNTAGTGYQAAGSLDWVRLTPNPAIQILTAAQNTTHWRSLGSAAELRAGSAAYQFLATASTLSACVHALSAYVHTDGTVPTTADCVLYAQGASVATTFESQDEEYPDWYRMYGTFTATAASSAHGVQVQAKRMVTVDDVQLEQKAYPTRYGNGELLGWEWQGTAHDSSASRAVGVVTLDNKYITPDHGAFTAWWRPAHGYDHPSHRDIFEVRGADDNNRMVAEFSLSTDRFLYYVNGATRCNSATQTFVAGDYVFFGVTWDFSNQMFALYVNDDTPVTAACALTPPNFGTSSLYLGTNRSSQNALAGTIHDLRIWDVALAASDITAIRTAGRGLGELPVLWTQAGDGIIYNHEDSGHYGSGWLLNVPGDLPAGMRMWVDPTANGVGLGMTDAYISLKSLPEGDYQHRFTYTVEAESMTIDTLTRTPFSGSGATGGSYTSLTSASGTNGAATGIIINYDSDVFKYGGAYRVFARCRHSGSTSGDWKMAITQVQTVGNAWGYNRLYDLQSVNYGYTDPFSSVNYLDLGCVDLPPLGANGVVNCPRFPLNSSGSQMSLQLDIDHDVNGSASLIIDSVELLPDDTLAWTSGFLGVGWMAYPMLLDTTEEQPVVCGVWAAGDTDLLGSYVLSGTVLRPMPEFPSRLIVRQVVSTAIANVSGADYYATDVTMHLSPRFRSLR